MITTGDVRRWVEEAAPALTGGFVHRVWRDDDAWVLLARHHEEGDPERRAERRVALEAALTPEWARCVAVPPELVQADDEKRKKAQARDGHPFLALLRRALVGARVTAVEQAPQERIVHLRFARRDVPDEDHRRRGEPPPPAHLLLAVELLGRSGNLLLAGADAPDAVPIVLGALHPPRAGRALEVGRPYALPARGESREVAERPPAVACDVAPDPATLRLGAAVATCQRAVAEAALQTSRHGQLLRAARNAVRRCEGITFKLEAQLADAGQADELEHRAELLKAHLGSIPRGARQAKVVDYASGAEVTLELDPSEPVKDQMEALFKRARKLRSGETAVRTRLGEVDGSRADLEAVLARVEAADSQDEETLGALGNELRKLGALPKEKGPRARAQVNQGPRSFRTLEGHEVLVGRSDEENDRLTMQLARGLDLFFHVRACPGSHVILRVDPKRPPNHDSLVDAALLAVHYSKARARGAVDVSYTPRKWVKKPRGAKPGLVQISNEKTIRVGHDPERLARVLGSRERQDDEEEPAP